MADADYEPAEPATGPAGARPPGLAARPARSGALPPLWAAAVRGLVVIVLAAAIAVGADAGDLALTGGAAACLVCLGAGWGEVLNLPDRAGTGLLVVLLGGAALLVVAGQPATGRPLLWFPALLAAGVLAGFGHELFRRDGRGELVESVTGTFTGQVLAVLAAGWPLLAGTGPGRSAVLVAAAAVAATLVTMQVLGLLPGLLPAPVVPWAAVAAGPVAATIASMLVDGVPVLTAIGAGAAVGAVGVVLDRLLTRPRAPAGLLAVLGSAAAPVAAAGTVAYTVVRIALG